MDSETDCNMSPPVKRAREDGTDADDEVPEPTLETRSRRRRLEDLEDDDDDDEDMGRESRQVVDSRHASEAMWRKENLPPPLEHEIEFILKDPTSYKQGQQVYSQQKTLHGCFTFRLLVFPMGTEVTSPPNQLAAFVEAVQPPGCEDIRWGFEGVKYQITAVNWKDWTKSTTQQDTFSFNRDHADRGWHKGFVKASQMTSESGWLNDDGELCLRASCSSRRAMMQQSSRRCSGHVGLKNHGATCYMNCLLQTLFCLGHFRHIAYSIEVPEAELSQVVASDDVSDSLGIDDDRPALPLLVSLQNLFYRLQTSEVPVSCRELMKSFGWDTADAFMQHDAQELNRLLCDRLEEQMKGTSTDGEIKRLFEGEFENYIECVDVDYRSQRNETFYDLQLNVRDESGAEITSLEDSLKDFVREEILEGDNAYDAESHGKQRARKGIRFKRFPPVLYIQLKRFMFDIEKMDMNKLNSKMEFPQILDLEAFSKGSGKYMLHTVIVHSGGVSSGHYYTFVRVRESEGKSQWIKFDDELVTFCSEQAAVEDNYGGEDLSIVNYFQQPQILREREWPSAQRIHNAYMLSYVRIDEKDLLTPPVLSLEDPRYKALIERCTREAKLAEERRRDRVQRMNRVEVKLTFERDLMKMKGFWPLDDFPSSQSMKIDREESGENLLREAMEMEPLRDVRVAEEHVALFVLTQRKTRQMRYKHLPQNDALKCHMQGAQAAVEPQMSVLVMISQGYNPFTLEATSDPEAFHDLDRWTDELILLIVKYFCPVKQIIVTLGCYYAQLAEPLKVMLDYEDSWLSKRLQLFVQQGEVVAPPPNTQWQCWEEFQKTPKEIKPRDIEKSMKEEGLYCGDVVIWQPQSTAGPRRPGAGEAQEEVACANVRDFAESCMNHISVIARLMSAEAPLCPEGIWSHLELGQPSLRCLMQRCEEDERELTIELPGQVKCLEMTVDARWRTDQFGSKVAKALDLEEVLLEGSGQQFWLLDGGAPTASRSAPVYHSKDSAPFATLQQMGWNRGLPKRSVYGVVLPDPPAGHHNLALHFFDHDGREAGARIVTVSEEEGHQSQNGGKQSGLFAVDPQKLLTIARQHLMEDASLRQRMCLRGKEPLRLLEAASGQISKVHRERSSGSQTDSMWFARSDDPTQSPNFLYGGLRVEPDPTVEDAELPAERAAPCQLVEVFTMDPNHMIGPFGHPFLLPVREGQLGKEIIAAVQEKMRCTAKDMRDHGCRILVGKGEVGESTSRQWKDLTDDFAWQLPADDRPEDIRVPMDWHVENMAICIERNHPVYMGRQMVRPGHRPLTIKAG